MNLTPDLLITIIKLLLCCIGGLAGIFATMVGLLHKSMTRRLDLIELDLKPMAGQIAMHTEQIGELKEDNKELNKWLGNHDSRIQTIESKLRHTS